MAPKRKLKKKKDKPLNCDNLEGETFHAHVDDMFRFNWWEICCFPYILCARFWDCCLALCSGTNQCLIYWMMLQWLVCKITRLTTPDPIIFPYYFYVFGQVILAALFFAIFWMLFGKSVVIPYFMAYYTAFTEPDTTNFVRKNVTRLSFRRYCFRKGEIFDTPVESSGSFVYPSYTSIFIVVCNIFLQQELY